MESTATPDIAAGTHARDSALPWSVCSFIRVRITSNTCLMARETNATVLMYNASCCELAETVCQLSLQLHVLFRRTCCCAG